MIFKEKMVGDDDSREELLFRLDGNWKPRKNINIGIALGHGY